MGNTSSDTSTKDDTNQNKSLEVTTVAIDKLKMKIFSALVSLNFDKKDAEIISDVILYAELRKNNQGIIKITSGDLKPNLTTLFNQSNFKTVF